MSGIRVSGNAIAPPVLAMVSYVVQNDAVGGREEVWRVSQSPGQDPVLLTAEEETLLGDILNSVQRPGGTTVVFADSDPSGFPTLESINADGTGRTVIRANSNGEVMDTPFWHPTENHVIFEEGGAERGRIARINIGGSGYTVIDEIPDDPNHPGWYRPQYNRDGTLIAAVRRDNLTDELYVMATDGSSQVLVSDGDFGYAGFGSQYGWANNSDVLAFADNVNGGIWKVNADGTGLAQLGSATSSGGFMVGKFCWVPDDSQVIAMGNFSKIYKFPAAGGAESLLHATAPTSIANEPPLIFGDRVYYWRNAGGFTDALVSIALDGSEWRVEHLLGVDQFVGQQQGMEAG